MKYKLEHTTHKKISDGKLTPLGANPAKDGVNFAILSRYAKEIYLLLFDTPDGKPTDIIKLEPRQKNIWSVFVHGLKPGQLYAYKIKGEYDPGEGMRFNEYKLLIDPCAKALTGKAVDKDNLLFGYDVKSPKKDLVPDTRDNTEIVPKCIVIDDDFNWEKDKSPNIPLEKLIIYETHVKGFTAHPSSGVKHPGTYLGFIEKIPYLKELGINAVELLPIQEFFVRDELIENGLNEYWGYNTIGFFAPESSYGTKRSLGCQVQEFKTLVRELHKAGIEVILDVVYNHTGEGNELGPTLCFKGVDNRTYYALQGPPEEPLRLYKNDTGCGNMCYLEKMVFLRFVMDSLRYWVDVMHVDGFRLDLATVLARAKGRYSKESVFFDAIAKDPVLKNVKLIAEPWDLTTYQVGNFPAGWLEWNGKFRDTMRKFIRGDQGQLPDVAKRVSGSQDLYGKEGSSTHSSVNFVTCHDGFTLYDLFSYENKHNEANGEHNKDGSDYNFSFNCGKEGDTSDTQILNLRKKMVKNALCGLFFSLGMPMMLGGDEFLRTQKGNNNAYCQDNDISWFNWDFLKKNADIFEFAKKTIAFRRRYAILQQKRFLTGQDLDGNKVPDVLWFGADLQNPNWGDPNQKLLCVQRDGKEHPSELGDYLLFFILNADANAREVALPVNEGKKWYRVIDTNLKSKDDFLSPGKEVLLKNQQVYGTSANSLVVLLGR